MRYRLSLEPRTCITCLAPSPTFSPPFSLLAHPALHQWSHDHLREASSLPPSKTGHINAWLHIKMPSYDTYQIFITNIPIPSPHTFHWCVLHGGRLLQEGMTLNERQQHAVLQAALAAFTYCSSIFTSQIHLFLPTPADSISLFHLLKHTDLFYSHIISTHLFNFLLANALHHITVLWQSADRSDAPWKKHCEHILHSLQPTIFPIIPPTLSTHESRALTTLGLKWDDVHHAHGLMSCIPRPGNDTLHPPPFLVGVNTQQKYNHQHRQLYTASICCFTHLDFTAGYSLKHCTYANDNISC